MWGVSEVVKQDLCTFRTILEANTIQMKKMSDEPMAHVMCFETRDNECRLTCKKGENTP